MRSILLPLLVVVHSISAGQQKLTKQQVNRIADAGKIYGYVKYFHPSLQYNNINWDSAFVSHAEEIIKAKDKSEYEAVIQKLLSALNDNMTSVVAKAAINNMDPLPTTSYNRSDGILYINFTEFASSRSIIEEAYKDPEKLNGIIFDMRVPTGQVQAGNPSGSIIDGAIVWDSSPLFFKGEAILPSLRKVYHKGVYETGFTHGSVFKITGTPLKNIPLVFIAKEEDEIPLAAVALQEKGVAAIVQAKGRELLLGRSINFYIADSILIKMRVAEAVNGDGTLSVVHPNAFYESADSTGTAIQTARKMIANGFESPSHRSHLASPVMFQTAQSDNAGYFPQVGNRLLAAAKIYAVINYFFPCKELMDKNWEEAYRTTVARFIEARDSLDYLRAVAELYSSINDSHGFITYGPFSLGLNPIIQGRGNYIPPVITGVIEKKVVVTGIYNDSICKKAGINKGDIILSIDGADPMKLIDANRKYQNASTIANQNFFISKFLLFGNKDQVRKLSIQDKNGKVRAVDLPTIRAFDGSWWGDDYTLSIYSQHTKPYFKLLTKDIGYVDLTSPLTGEAADSMAILFRNTQSIIFDDRGYPHYNGGIPWKALVKHPEAVLANYTINVAVTPNAGDIGAYEENPKEIYTSDQRDFKNMVTGNPGSENLYRGKIVVLINEAAQSWGDDVPMKWKTACDAILIGSPTSGTDAAMSSFTIPGNLTLYYSALVGSLPNGKRVQRVGVQPDIFVSPTIKGIQSGKDELLERAINYLQTGK